MNQDELQQQLETTMFFSRCCYYVLLSHASSFSGAQSLVRDMMTESTSEKMHDMCGAAEKALIAIELEARGIGEQRKDLLDHLTQCDGDNLERIKQILQDPMPSTFDDKLGLLTEDNTDE